MPVIVAKKAGSCTAAGCGGRVLKGEYVEYSAATGTRHLECAGADQGMRPNLKAGTCRCGAAAAPREGSLVLKETTRGGRFVKRWLVLCRRCSGLPTSS
ncbi:hypothetical protein JYJ95_06685 [Corallococcus exiguus]|uniref:hypothetical protein n=1 Tax=Corallococcus exiguus TaxID=83462 RepID=UPI001A8F5A56|nr:hypothetical protein [Corallococcus exiguus]MBN8466191.1 hypothetical protein [Corallococcus exiguus]